MESSLRIIVISIFVATIAVTATSTCDDSNTDEERALCVLEVLRRRMVENERRQEETESDRDEYDNDVMTGDESSSNMAAILKRSNHNKFVGFAGNKRNRPQALERNFLRFGRSAVTLASANGAADAADAASNERKRAKDDGEYLRKRSNSNKMADEDDEVQMPVPVLRSRVTLNPSRLNLIRELSRKRGALERNFLRFGKRRGDGSADSGEHEQQRQQQRAIAMTMPEYPDEATGEDLSRSVLLDEDDANMSSDNNEQIRRKRAASAALDRNFLRFGKKRGFGGKNNDDNKPENSEDNKPENGKDNNNGEQVENVVVGVTDDVNVSNDGTEESMLKKKRRSAALDRNFLRFGRTGSHYNHYYAGPEAARQNESWKRMMIGNSDDGSAKRSSAALERNFLRFGRNNNNFGEDDVIGGSAGAMKRASALDRNFLRFGRDPSSNRKWGDESLTEYWSFPSYPLAEKFESHLNNQK